MSYDREEIEKKWQRYWREEKIYRFDPNSSKPIFSIDNPPRYASGALHAGHAVNYTQIDFVARYKRMRGYNVFFPLCFDTNGMPIEVKVEKKYGITKDKVGRQEFIEKCREFANSFIDTMTKQFEVLGESMDPDIYYQTDADYYRRITQITFIRLYKQGLIYRDKFPVNWCPRCQTAIADAEVEYVERKTLLNYVVFKTKDEGKEIEIATTRPELLATCQLVAVHPDDWRYSHLIGKYLITPIYEKAVEVVADEKVDPHFGTGVVMICTIGDKDDLEWVFKYGLPIENAIDEKGRMTEIAGKYAGMSIEDARRAIIEDLKAKGLITKQEEISQNIGVCWRCGTPIEFLNVQQWFLKTREFKEDVLKVADEVEWYPEYMKQRLVDWVNSLTWDWPISRQRYFATPIPAWICEDCGHVVLAREEDCYIDPTVSPPPVEKCEVCGGTLKGCEEVFDTWMDSSITPLFNAYWERDSDKFKKLYPMSLRPQSQDIIRTWAYYTILRCYLLTGEKPWEHIMIGAYILAPDGTPMHASKGNVVDPLDLLAKYGSDAVRYWAAMCGLGEDAIVNYKEMVRGQRFCTKLWNVEKLIGQFFDNYEPKKLEEEELRVVDKWILTRYSKAVNDVTNYLESYEFDRALKRAEQFIWHEFADHYLEMVKHRLYSKNDEAALYTTYTVGLGIAKLVSPFLPHITEEIYHRYYKAKVGEKSIHLTSWPEPLLLDESAEKVGEKVKEIIAAIRRWKVEQGIPLSADMGSVSILWDESVAGIEECLDIVKNTVHAKDVAIIKDAEVEQYVIEIRPRYEVIGPKYREMAKYVVDYLRNSDPERLVSEIKNGIRINTPEGVLEISGEDVVVVYEQRVRGKNVETVEANGTVIAIENVGGGGVENKDKNSL